MRRDARVGVGRRQRAAAILATVSLGMAMSFSGAHLSFAAEDGPAEFADGWRKEVALTDPNGGNKSPHCVAWIDDGWLVVERRDTTGDVEWQIVLAEVGEDDEPPTIKPNPGGVRLTYRNGRFFIHDDWGHLRCMRQKKSAQLQWPALAIPPHEPQPGGSGTMGKGDRKFYYRTNHGWQFLARGSEGERAEYVLRMYCLDVGAFQLSSRGDRGGVDEITVGANYRGIDSSTVFDDCELLVARRMHEANVALYREKQEKLLAGRKQLVGAAPPEIVAAKWLNGSPVAMAELKGKVAFVYYAGDHSWQMLRQLTAIAAFYNQYHDRGLEVVAVVPLQDEEVYAALIKERGWKFPFAVDGRDSTILQRYFVTDSPACFLIGCDGNISLSQYPERGRVTVPPLPTAKEIEDLLGAGDK